MSSKKWFNQLWFSYVLCALLGGFFIFSAFTKTRPINYFEFIIATQLHTNHFLSAYIARFMIGLEAGLGFLLVLNIYGRDKWVLKMTILLLIAFTIHLLLLLWSAGSEINCGCMGSLVPMSAKVSIYKNLGLLILSLLALRYTSFTNNGILHWVASLLLGAIIITAFIVFPKRKEGTLAVSNIYTQHRFSAPVEDLRKGKHMLAFLSMTCPHCIDAATKLSAMKDKDTSLPIYYFLVSPQSDSTRHALLQDFLAKTNTKQVPHYFLGQDIFLATIGSKVPAMYWLQDTTIARQISVHELNQQELEMWLKQ